MIRALTLVSLIAFAPSEQAMAREAAGDRPATIQEIRSFLKDLHDFRIDLRAARAAVRGEAGPSKAWRMEECRFQSLEHGTWTAREEYLTARCATEKWSVAGGLPKLQDVIACESGWNRFARSSSGSYVGLAQHAASAYVSRIHAYEPPAWDMALSTNWRNSRGQLVMTVRMAQAGWGPWTCA